MFRRDAFNQRFNLTDLLVAKLGVVLQRAQDDFIQSHVNLHFSGRGLEFPAGQLAGKHLVKNHAQRVDVGAVIHLARCLNLLRRHVLRRAHDLAGAGQFPDWGTVSRSRLVRQRGFRFSRCNCRIIVAAAGTARHRPHNLRQPEIRHLHAAAPVEQEIFRLDIAVDDTLVMGELEGITNLGHDGQRFPRGDAPGVEQLPQIHAIHKFHEEKVEAIRAAKFVDSDDTGMVEFGEGSGFTGEALGKRGIVADVGREDFESHDAVELLLSRLVDSTHAALTDKLENFELGKPGRKFGQRGRGEAGCFAAGIRAGGKRPLHQARRAKALGRTGIQRFAALRTDGATVHALYYSIPGSRLPTF